MAKFNLYKIKLEEELNLLLKFEQVGLQKQDPQTVDGFELSFFFSTEPDEVDIWWVSFYRAFLSKELHDLKNKIYYGVLLIKKEKTIFAVSLSKSHFYIKDFCDQDFGLNLAERIANEKDVKIKNTKFFKNKRNKVITSYHNDSSIDFESGESMHFLKARSIEPEKWGKTVAFGQSVQFVIDNDYKYLPKLVENIETELKKDPRIHLPKVVPITDEKKIAELDQKLITALEANDGSSAVEESEFTLSGVDFTFSDEYEYSFFLEKKYKDKSEKGTLSLERLNTFLSERSLRVKDCLDQIKITVHKQHGRDHSVSFKNYLEYVDENEKLCLIDGKWYVFNQSYINYLRQEIDTLACDITVHSLSLLTEKDFLDDQEKNGFKIIHTNLESVDGKYKVEAGDMVKGDTLYVVKKGEPKQFNYAIDQAIGSVNYLQENNNTIIHEGTSYQIKNVCLLLLLSRKKTLTHLFELSSLIFHMKLIDWQRVTRGARLIPTVQIEQYNITEVKV